jgi:predicted SprT family Zn-dependent metalloprotease
MQKDIMQKLIAGYIKIYPTGYGYYMSLIKELDPLAYEQLKQCAINTGSACIIISDRISVESTERAPIIVLTSDFQGYSKETQKGFLKILLEWYKKLGVQSVITTDEREQVLNFIKDYAPNLYEIMIKKDPSESSHVYRYYQSGASAYFSYVDGLPTISVNPTIMQLPKDQRDFVLAHELAHYILGHIADNVRYKAVHTALVTKQKTTPSFGKITFESAFKQAYSREQEYEADTFAVVELGAPIDAAIEYAKDQIAAQKEKQEEPSTRVKKESPFEQSHPLWERRLQNLENLRREIELSQTRSPKPIDWKKLSEDYLQLSEEIRKSLSN